MQRKFMAKKMVSENANLLKICFYKAEGFHCQSNLEFSYNNNDSKS